MFVQRPIKNVFIVMLKIAVVSGGYSSEYDISILSGETVFNNLDTSIYEPYQVLITSDN